MLDTLVPVEALEHTSLLFIAECRNVPNSKVYKRCFKMEYGLAVSRKRDDFQIIQLISYVGQFKIV